MKGVGDVKLSDVKLLGYGLSNIWTGLVGVELLGWRNGGRIRNQRGTAVRIDIGCVGMHCCHA